MSVEYRDHFRQALIDGDAMLCWKIMTEVQPHIKIKSLAEAEAVMHRARTELVFVPFRARAYSHAWLCERNLPSALPDELRPKAERLYPRVAQIVGIAVKMPKLLHEVAQEVESSMSSAVSGLAADGADLSDRPLVHGQMFAARDRTLKGFGLLKRK